MRDFGSRHLDARANVGRHQEHIITQTGNKQSVLVCVCVCLFVCLCVGCGHKGLLFLLCLFAQLSKDGEDRQGSVQSLMFISLMTPM